MRLGFQYPSPFERIEHHRYGDDGWQVTIRRHGDRWSYSTIHAFAHFGPDNAADLFVDHPGEIAIFARLHLALGAELDGVELWRMNSQQVADRIGGVS